MCSALHRLRLPACRALGWGTAVLRVVLVLLPLVLIRDLAKDNRTNTLFMDDWAYVPLYEKAVRGGLTLHDFFAGYLEHRPAVARVIAVATTVLSKGDVRYQCLVAFGSITLTWAICGVLLRRAVGGWRRVWLPWALMGWIFFCPVQWQEFLWPSCHMDTLPLLFLSASLLVLGWARLSLTVRWAACVCFAWLATYSFAAGLTLWVLVPAVVACGYGVERLPERRRFILCWSVPMGLVLLCYFHGLKNEEDAPFAYGQGNEDTMTHSVAAVLHSPTKGLKFAVTLLGANLARGVMGVRWNVACALGTGLCLVFAAAIFVLGRVWRRASLRSAALPFAVIALYGFCVAGMVAAGRAWASKDVGGALNNRYACFATAFVAGLAGLCAVLAARPFVREPTVANGERVLVSRDRLRAVAGALGGVLVGLLVANWLYGAQMMEHWHYSRLRGAVDIHFSAVLGLAQDRGLPAQNLRLARDRAAVMDGLGYLERPLARTLDLDQFALKGGLDEKLGRITGTERSTDGIVINGYAMQTMHGRPPDAVMITWRNEATDGTRQIAQVVMPDGLPAFFLTATMKDMQYVLLDDFRPKRFGQWSAKIMRADLPQNARLRIEAWVLNFDRFDVKKIGDGFLITN